MPLRLEDLLVSPDIILVPKGRGGGQGLGYLVAVCPKGLPSTEAGF